MSPSLASFDKLGDHLVVASGAMPACARPGVYLLKRLPRLILIDDLAHDLKSAAQSRPLQDG